VPLLILETERTVEVSGRVIRLGVLITALAAILAGCGGGGAAAVGDAEAGRQVFETGGASGIPCTTCHTLDGSDLVGPSLQGIADRAGTRVEGLSAEEYLRESIRNPSAYVVEGLNPTMPAIYADTLSEDDIDNLVAYLLSQSDQ
jgi:cytochrome c2